MFRCVVIKFVMIFHGAFYLCVNLLTHEAFKALLIHRIELNHFYSGCLRLIYHYVLILCGLLSHIKSKMVLSTLLLKFSGSDKTEALYVTYSPCVLTILIFPTRVNLLLFQEFGIFPSHPISYQNLDLSFASIVGELDT